jgi:hypothetical protein
MEIKLDIPDALGMQLMELPNFQQFAIRTIQAALKQKNQLRADIKWPSIERRSRIEKKKQQLSGGVDIMQHDYKTDKELTIISHSLSSDDFYEYEKK